MPRDTSAGGDRRSNGALREQAQAAFETLAGLFEELGDAGVATRLRELRTVESVMREEPLLVPMLLNSVWKLKDQDTLKDRLTNPETGEPVTDKQTPLGPCGRSFEDVQLSHLLGTARLYFKRCARDWAVRETARQTRVYEAKIKSHLIKNVWRTVTKSHPTFTLSSVEKDYPGHGLYDAIKGHLLDQKQFKLLPVLSTLSAAHVLTLGESVRGISDQNALEGLRALQPGEVAVLLKCARAFAETVLCHPDACVSYLTPRDGAGPLHTSDNRVETLAGEVLSHLVLNHRLRVNEVLTHQAVAEDIVKKLAVSMGHDLWSVFASQEAVTNLSSVPATVAEGLGGFCQHISPDVADLFGGFSSLAVCRDLLLIALERHGEEMVKEWVESPSFLDLWPPVVASFPEGYKYSRDHEGEEFNNWADLKQKAVQLFEPFCRPIHKHKELIDAA